MNRYNVILAPSFTKMVKYELNRYGVIYASKIEKGIYDAVILLKLFPFASQTIKFKGKPGTYRKITIIKRFLIVFRITNNDVHLLYFIDGRQSPKNYFKNIQT